MHIVSNITIIILGSMIVVNVIIASLCFWWKPLLWHGYKWYIEIKNRELPDKAMWEQKITRIAWTSHIISIICASVFILIAIVSNRSI